MRRIDFDKLRTRLSGRARSTIYEDLKYERLPNPIKVGGKLYWEETQLDNWYKRQYTETKHRKRTEAEQ